MGRRSCQNDFLYWQETRSRGGWAYGSAGGNIGHSQRFSMKKVRRVPVLIQNTFYIFMSIKSEKFVKIGLGAVKNAQYSIYAYIAREYYVTARISIISQRYYSAALLMEQSIELYIKAFLFYQYRKQTWNNKNGHKLRELLEGAQNDIPLFKSVLSNATYMELVDDLQKGYNDIRFGESQISVKRHQLLNIYDKLMYDFISEFFAITKIPGIDTVIVHKQCQEQFLQNLNTKIKYEIFPAVF